MSTSKTHFSGALPRCAVLAPSPIHLICLQGLRAARLALHPEILTF